MVCKVVVLNGRDLFVLINSIGDILAYDLDRQALAPLKISNLWRERNPRARLISVVALALHPRDIGTLLIGYSEGAVIFSFKQNKPINFFQYETRTNTPGGTLDHSSNVPQRTPGLVHAIWHPTGTFLLTGHDDATLVVWDSKNGKMILARNIRENNVEQYGSASAGLGSTPGTFTPRSPLFRIAWCSKPNPDDTGLLIAGGSFMNTIEKGLTFLDLGQTPIYATSSWQVLSDHFQKPKGSCRLPTPPNTEVVDFCLIPRSSPHYAGSHDPIAVIAILESGELITMSFPSGHPITPTNQLHASLTFLHPFVTHLSIACIERTRWLGMVEKRSQGPPMLTGGAEATRPMKRYEDRNVLQTAHADGTIRIWDAGHGDEVENEGMLQVDVSRALGREYDVEVTKTSMSGATGELAVGLRTGEVAIFRYDRNRTFGQDLPHVVEESFGLENISDRAEPSLKEGLLPLTLLTRAHGPVTALKMSDVGFVVAGFEKGSLAVVDLRGPALIYKASLQDFAKVSTRGSLRKSTSSQPQEKAEWPTAIEFGVMSLEGEGNVDDFIHPAVGSTKLTSSPDYSSILFFVGTNLGRLLTFKLLPQSHGGYGVEVAGSTGVDDRVICISPIQADNGKPAYATQRIVAGLRNGLKVIGVILVVTQSGARIFKPVGAKGASKTWHDMFCDSACVVRYDDRRCGLIGLFGDGSIRSYSIPGLKEIASIQNSNELDTRRYRDAVVTPTGDIFGWTGPSEIAVVNPWGSGQDL